MLIGNLPMSKFHTHYDNLQVERDAPAELIHASFITLLRKYDPELYPGSTEAIRITKVLESSYAVLSLSESRKAYDEALAAHESATQQKPVVSNTPKAETPVAGQYIKPASQQTSQQPFYPEAKIRDKESGTWLYMVLSLTVVCLVGYGIASNSSSPSGNPATLLTSSSVNKPVSSPAWEADWSVASARANLRKEASGKSKILQKLVRGKGLQRISEKDGFIKVQMEKGEVGFISADHLIPKTDYERLKDLTAEDFIKMKSNGEDSAQKLQTLMAQYGEVLNSIYKNLLMRDSAVLKEVDKLVSAKDEFLRISSGYSFDTAAAKWFSLRAVEARAIDDRYQTSINYLAAKLADPSTAGIDSAIVFSGYELMAQNNMRGALINNALWAVLKEPKTANAWVSMGLSMAMAGETPENNVRFASGAFLLAMRYSKSVDVTRNYLSNLATNAIDTNVKRALDQALLESPQGPPPF